MKSQLLLTLPLLLLSTSAFAQTVSEGEALDKALNFLQSSQSRRARGQQSSPQLTLAHKSAQHDETYYYVFNNQAGGFIIIGGDEVAQDVLGYADSGTFDYDQLPASMKWFLSCYDHQISSAIQQVKAGKVTADDVEKAKRRAARKAPKVNIDYLVQTKWDQVAPFNCMHPFNIQEDTIEDDEYGIATGCVATAGAQLMKYHEWPNTGVGSHTDLINSIINRSQPNSAKPHTAGTRCRTNTNTTRTMAMKQTSRSAR